MCPVCIAAAAVIAGKVTSAGGITAIGIRKLASKSSPTNPTSPDLTNAVTENSSPNSKENPDVHQL